MSVHDENQTVAGSSSEASAPSKPANPSSVAETAADPAQFDKIAQDYIHGKRSLEDYKRVLDARIPSRDVLVESWNKHEGFILQLSKLLNKADADEK